MPPAPALPPPTSVQRYVTTPDASWRRYLKLLHGNVAGMPEPERDRFLQELHADAAQVSDREIAELLDSGGWRQRLTAGWLVAADRREAFQGRIGELLLDSAVCFAGQGYCLALARLATPQAADALTAYLDRYLRRPDLRYDQDWAMGALARIDATAGTGRARIFTAPGGLWESWAPGDRAVLAQRTARHLERLCDLLDGGRHL